MSPHPPGLTDWTPATGSSSLAVGDLLSRMAHNSWSHFSAGQTDSNFGGDSSERGKRRCRSPGEGPRGVRWGARRMTDRCWRAPPSRPLQQAHTEGTGTPSVPTAGNPGSWPCGHGPAAAFPKCFYFYLRASQ